MKKGIFHYIQDLLFKMVGHAKVIDCQLIANKINEQNIPCNIIECGEKEIIIQCKFYNDIAMYKLSVNDRNCISNVEFIGLSDS